VGDGELKSLCEQTIQALHLSKNVSLLGSQTPAQVAILMQNAYCFVQHSITAANNDMEGTPVSIVEAGMAGLPVISTLHAGIPDIVVDGETGFLVRENDVKGMADRMKRLAADKSLAQEMGKKAHKRISENFSIPICVEREWDVIKQFIK
jgi:glycosyltransferase involved in cell wall biosynthesis